MIAAARRSGEPWFCLEQPDREGAALAALGCVRELSATGHPRFTTASRAWRALVADAIADPPAMCAGAGLVALGGFAFAADGGRSPGWREFGGGSLQVPEVSLARRGGRTWVTVNLRGVRR